MVRPGKSIEESPWVAYFGSPYSYGAIDGAGYEKLRSGGGTGIEPDHVDLVRVANKE